MQSVNPTLASEETRCTYLSASYNIGKFNLTVPNLMPDEFLLGYFGRLSKQNGLVEYRQGKRIINNIFIDKASRYNHYPLALQMSELLGMAPNSVVRDHTLTATLRSLDYKNLDASDLRILQSQGCCLAKENVYLCTKCVEEDLDYLGFSFWRTSHQLHGVDFCSKHFHPLMIALSSHASFNSPDQILRNQDFELTAITENDYRHPIIQNYIQLMDDHSHHQSVIDFKSMLKYLNLKCDLINLNINTKEILSISDIILRETPNGWLLKHFPAFNRKTTGQILRCIDHAYIKGRSPSLVNLLLMLTNLCPNIAYTDLREIQLGLNNRNYLAHENPRKQHTSRICKHLNLSFKSLNPINSSINPEINIRETFKAFTDFLSGTSLSEVLQSKKVDIARFEHFLRESCQI